MPQIVDDEFFLETFVSTFEELHSAVIGSRKILQLKNLSIHEEKLPTGEMVNCYFFYGDQADYERLIPVLREKHKSAYCAFHETGSTITIKFEEGEERIVCSFGYILFVDKLLKGWRKSDRSNESVGITTIQILSHEIRHEIQAIHSLDSAKFRTNFESKCEFSTSDFDQKFVKENLEGLYQECYIDKGCPAETLATELDAIITSYMALCEWHKDDSSDNDQKFQKIIEIIKGDFV